MKKGDIFNLPKYAGIFTLTQKSTGKVYVGQAIKLRKRLLYLLESNEEPIAKVFIEDNLKDFEFKLHYKFSDALSPYTKQVLKTTRKKLIEELQTLEPNGFNTLKETDTPYTGIEI